MIARRGLLLKPKGIPDNQLMEKRGAVAHLMARSKHYRKLPMGCLSVWIEPALLTNQLAIFYRWNDGKPVGYITWAFLAPAVEDRWKNDPKVLLHDSEWNEDGALWIMDFLALPGYCEDILEFIDQNMFAGHTHAFSLRRNPDGTVRKLSCWRRRSVVRSEDR